MTGEWPRRGLILAVGLLSLAACTQARSSPREAACPTTLPAFARDAKIGTITSATGPVGIVSVARDSSVTLVGICGSALFRETPTLGYGETRLRPAGGAIAFTGDQETTFLIFQPTRERELRVELEGEHLANVQFDDEPDSTCSMPASTDARVTACESILNAVWNTDLDVPADEVQSIEGQVADEGLPDRLLGFYLFGVDNGATGLRITFGFQRPAGTWVRARLTSLVLRSGTSVAAAISSEVDLSVDR